MRWELSKLKTRAREADRRTASASLAFSLIEVVIAIGVLAVGIVTAIALLAPITKSVATTSEAEAATRVADAILAHLRALPLSVVASHLKTADQLDAEDANPRYNPAADERLFFASLHGDKIGPRSDTALWSSSDAEKFFEIALFRNESLSPEGNDPAAPWLAFNVRVRWPLFRATAAGEVQVGADPNALVPFDHSQKSVMLFAGSVRR